MTLSIRNIINIKKLSDRLNSNIEPISLSHLTEQESAEQLSGGFKAVVNFESESFARGLTTLAVQTASSVQTATGLILDLNLAISVDTSFLSALDLLESLLSGQFR